MPDPARIVTPGPPPGGPLVVQPAAILALSARCQGVSSRVWECRSGWRVPRRRQGDAAVFAPLDGRAVIELRGRRIAVGPGEAVAVAAGEAHAMGFAPGCARLTILCVHAHWHDDRGRSLLLHLADPHLAVPTAIRDLWLRAAGLDGDPGRALIGHGLALWWGLVPVILAELPGAGDPRIAAFQARALADPGASIADLAAAVGLSPARLRALGCRELGMPPKRWFDLRRLEAAARRLRAGDEPVAAVAAACGWASPGRFHAAFRRWSGHSPGAWRRMP
jgi:AraC-like DNA-binding protein